MTILGSLVAGGAPPAVAELPEPGRRFLSTDGAVPVESSAARAIGVSISREVLEMTMTRMTAGPAVGGTMEIPDDAARRAAVARAQAELIEQLARLVLAASEAGAVATDTTCERGADDQRPRGSRV